MMIVINEHGLDELRKFLVEKHVKGPSMTYRDIRELAESAEWDEWAEIRFNRHESVDGVIETFKLPEDGFELHMTLDELVEFSEDSYWDDRKWVKAERLETTIEMLGRDGSTVEREVWRGKFEIRASAKHESGIEIVIRNEADIRWIGGRNYASEEEIEIEMACPSIEVEGVTLISQAGTNPMSYLEWSQKYKELYEKLKHQFNFPSLEIDAEDVGEQITFKTELALGIDNIVGPEDFEFSDTRVVAIAT